MKPGDIMQGKNKKMHIENGKTNYWTLNYQVLEGMADWVRVIGKNGKVLYANKSMKDHLGENIVGSRCFESICNLEECRVCISNQSMETGDIVQKEEKIDGNYYSVKSSPVRDENGEIFAAVEVFRNVTRERKLEKELIGKNNKMHSDLQFAKRIQEKILPRKGKIDNLQLDYIYKPSEMLSGDMFDMYKIDEDHIGIYISDVAGKGVSASMLTMFIRQTMRVMKDHIISPGQALKELHRRFLTLDFEVERYFTIFYGVYNKKTGSFIYANAGHNCIPIKYNESSEELLENKGYPISQLFTEIDYLEKELRLDRNDKLLFYTDGITESRDYNGREFGLEGILEIVKRRPKNILSLIEEEVIDFSWGEQADDFAMVLLQLEE